jgi:hypothetical protein
MTAFPGRLRLGASDHDGGASAAVVEVEHEDRATAFILTANAVRAH